MDAFHSRKKRAVHREAEGSDARDEMAEIDDENTIPGGPLEASSAPVDGWEAPERADEVPEEDIGVDFMTDVGALWDALQPEPESGHESDFDSSFASYVDTMAAHAVSIIQICESIFVVQGWNARLNSGTV